MTPTACSTPSRRPLRRTPSDSSSPSGTSRSREECVADYCAPDTEIAFYVDGEPFEGDPATIEIADHREIAIVIGTPPAEIPDSFAFPAM